jgi:arylsulfatase A-like enzyme
MRVIFVLFDTLNRHFLQSYGGSVMETPQFARLAKRTVQFDNHYVGSLPCMPARRDLQTGRLNFMHRSWGPLEPFDRTLAEALQKRGVYSHLITDHYHYQEVGGCGYQNSFTSYEFVRGQESDAWKADVRPPLETWQQTYHPDQISDNLGDPRYHNLVNRAELKTEDDFPSVRCFDLACDFLDDNNDADNWFLQLETFDPHEPFTAPERLRAKFPTGYNGLTRDWPPYARVTESPEEAAELRANYMALLSLCDEQLGRLLDKMDALDMWKDTMLVVSTDHGYLVGEHGWWAKNRMPAYQEIAHIPLFVHHPEHADLAGLTRSGLSQTPDLMPTILDAFACDAPDAVRGCSLLPHLADPQAPTHDAVIYGYFGGAINVTDGRHTYFRYPENLQEQQLYNYTLMPCHMHEYFSADELKGAEMIHDLPYAEGYPVMRVPIPKFSPWYRSHGPAVMVDSDSLAFDTHTDPEQLHPISDPALHQRMTRLLLAEMVRNDAPPEAFARLNLHDDLET